MFKNYPAIALGVLMIGLFSTFSAFAQTSNDRDSQLVYKIKNKIAEIGTEPNRKVKIRLSDGTKLKGYITEIKDDHFSMFDKNSGKVVPVEYAKVVEVKRDGISKTSRFLITTAVGMTALIILLRVALAHDR